MISNQIAASWGRCSCSTITPDPTSFKLHSVLLVITRLPQGYHGLAKEEDRIWMDLDREHGRGLVHHPGHPLGWPGLPPPDGLPGPPPPPPAHLSSLSSPTQTPQTLAGDPNGVPPPGNSGIPATTGPSTPANGGAKDGPALQGSRPVLLQVCTLAKAYLHLKILSRGPGVPSSLVRRARGR